MCCYVFTIDRQAVIALSHLYQWMTSWTPPLRLETVIVSKHITVATPSSLS